MSLLIWTHSHLEGQFGSYSQAVFQDFGPWEDTGGLGESADWWGKKVILKISLLGCHVTHKPSNDKCCTKGHLNVTFLTSKNK